MNKIVTTTLLCLFALCSLLAQPKKGISSLDFKLGKWEWKTRGLVVPGDPTVYNGAGYSYVYFINDSTALLDDHRIEWENGVVYRAITYRTYDSANDVMMVVWAQSGTGNTLKIEGTWQGEKFVETSSGTDAYGDWKDRLELYDISDTSHKAKLVRTYTKSGYQLTLLEYDAIRTD